MLRPIVGLIAARTRRRGATTVLGIAAIAMATALVAVVAGIGLVAADATLARALATSGADRPAVRVTDFSSSARDADQTAQAAGRVIADLDPYVDATVRGALFHQLVDRRSPIVDLVVAVDDPEDWLTLAEGRAPAPCLDGVTCEAVLLAERAPDFPFQVAVPGEGMALTIVGRGQLDPAIPFDDLDQRGPVGEEPGGGQYQTSPASPAVLLVNGVDALAHSPILERAGRTYVWTQPVDLDAIHPWTATAFRAATDEAALELTREGTGYTLTSPANLIRTELGRADAASGRLLLIGSLGVAILLAFAVFLALVVREDVAAESARLASVGAARRDRVVFLILEALLPALIGGIVGWLAGGTVVGALAAWSGVDAGAIVAGTLLSPGAILSMLGVLLIAVVAVTLATAPGVRFAGAARVAGAAASTAVLILAWQLAAGGSLGADALARSLVSPIVVLLPPILAFVLALAFVAVLPPVLRGLARRTRRSPLPVRLSLLSISREPARPAATLTLLAFSLGAIVFAAGWSASLRQGIDDGAAYRSGLDLRVGEHGTAVSISSSVVPVDRYATLGPDLGVVPVYRDSAANQEGGRVDLLALPPELLPELPGWREDFSTTSAADLVTALTLPTPAGGWTVGGHRLDPGSSELALDIDYEGRPLRLDAVVATADGDRAVIRMGDVDVAMDRVAAPLPREARGGVLIALVFRNPGLVAGSGHQDELRRATVRFHGLDGLVDDRPHELEIFTTSVEVIRAPQATDGLRLPALVSPDLAAAAGDDGALDLNIATDTTIPLQVVGVADHLPTVVDADPRFVLLPRDPFLLALTASVPGAGRPNEVWIRLPDPGGETEVRAALAEGPFRYAQVTSRADLVAERATDPLSRAIVWTLLAAALAGLALSVAGLILGTVTDLRDERGELADLESQGVPPATLRWHAIARTGWLALGGTVAGLAVGVVLTVVVSGALALTSEGQAPIPPLAVVIPVPTVAVIVVIVLTVVLGSAAWLARRSLGRATLGERRGARSGEVTTAWLAGGERIDG